MLCTFLHTAATVAGWVGLFARGLKIYIKIVTHRVSYAKVLQRSWWHDGGIVRPGGSADETKSLQQEASLRGSWALHPAMSSSNPGLGRRG